jgi:hypothetical protein
MVILHDQQRTAHRVTEVSFTLPLFTLFYNFRFIHSTNRKNLNFKLSTNHMADVGDDEYIRYRGSKEERRYIDQHSNQSLINDGAFNISGVPDTLDWRDYGKLANVD